MKYFMFYKKKITDKAVFFYNWTDDLELFNDMCTKLLDENELVITMYVKEGKVVDIAGTYKNGLIPYTRNKDEITRIDFGTKKWWDIFK